MSADDETIKAQFAEIWELSAHLKANERADLAASLAIYPKAVFEGFSGWGIYLHREILKGRLTGKPSQWEWVLKSTGRDIEKMLNGGED
jgi:hypothetical protein